MSGIRPDFNQAQVQRYLQGELNKIQSAILSRFQTIGEKFVTDARSKTRANGGYGDVTGNLRASIGYIILRDGVQLTDFFPGDKAVGRNTGRKIADEVAASYPQGFILICVAGMDYAAAVESRGKDVITGSSLIAKEALKKAIASLQKKL